MTALQSAREGLWGEISKFAVDRSYFDGLPSTSWDMLSFWQQKRQKQTFFIISKCSAFGKQQFWKQLNVRRLAGQVSLDNVHQEQYKKLVETMMLNKWLPCVIRSEQPVFHRAPPKTQSKLIKERIMMNIERKEEKNQCSQLTSRYFRECFGFTTSERFWIKGMRVR